MDGVHQMGLHAARAKRKRVLPQGDRSFWQARNINNMLAYFRSPIHGVLGCAAQFDKGRAGTISHPGRFYHTKCTY